MNASALLERARADDIRVRVENGRVFVASRAPLPPTLLAEFRAHKAELLDYLSSPPRVYLDFETASKLDLPKVGASAYAEHPSTRALLLCYALGDAPVQTWRPGQPMPEDLRQVIAAGATCVAHNIGFELAIWQAHQVPLGWPALPWHRWSDTAARARHARLPGSLKGAAEVLRLDQQKDAVGKAHMRKLAKTCFRGGSNPTAADLDRLAAYCVRDVETLRALDSKAPELDADAAAIAEMDFAMNERGMPVDLAAVRKLIAVRDREDKRLKAELIKVTAGAITTADQCRKILAFLARHGVELPNVQAETLEAWEIDNPERDDLAATVIKIRREHAHAANKKLDTLLAAAASSGRVRGCFLPQGAHTGRWAGRGAQLQNLPKGVLQDTAATLARLTSQTLVPDDSPDGKLSIKAQIAGVLRGVFLAPEGQLFAVADLNQVEPRVLAWLAGAEDKLDLYRRGEDVYLPAAKAIGAEGNRPLGKLLELSAGYGAGSVTLLREAREAHVPMTPAEADAHIAAWRRANPKIVTFWNDLLGAFRQVVMEPLGVPPIALGCLSLWRVAGAVFIELPSGRRLIYPFPRIEPMDEDGFRTRLVVDLPERDRMKSVPLWRGHLTENVVSAIACDLLTTAMLTLHREGVPITATVHDEIVAMVPAEQAAATLDRMLRVLSLTPSWAPGLPLAAEGYVNTRYFKPKEKAL